MITITAKVNPASKQENIALKPNGEWHIKIHANPINGDANKYLIQFLATTFDIRKSNISIQKGFNNRIKKIQLDITEKKWQNIQSIFIK